MKKISKVDKYAGIIKNKLAALTALVALKQRQGTYYGCCCSCDLVLKRSPDKTKAFKLKLLYLCPPFSFFCYFVSEVALDEYHSFFWQIKIFSFSDSDSVFSLRQLHRSPLATDAMLFAK